MYINIITDGKESQYMVNYNDLIKDIKVKHQLYSSIPAYRQHFIYKDKELNNDKTLKDYKIPRGACITNKISKIPKDPNSQYAPILPEFKSQNEEKEEAKIIKITIKDYSGNFSTYNVKDDDTVFSLKIQISQQINVFPDHMELYIDKEFLEDEGLINQYVKDNNTIIDLLTENDKNKVINLNIANMNGVHQFSLKFVPKFNIKRLIEKISKLLNAKPHLIYLFYNDNPLYDIRDLLSYSIHDGATIKLDIDDVSPSSIRIHVKTLTGKPISFEVLPTNKISEVVSKIILREGIPIEFIRLAFSNRLIYPSDDDFEIGEKGIKQDSVLHMVHRGRY